MNTSNTQAHQHDEAASPVFNKTASSQSSFKTILNKFDLLRGSKNAKPGRKETPSGGIPPKENGGSKQISYPPPTGHEIDRLQYHIGLQDFGAGLQKAANAIFPRQQASRYDKVDVILLSWEDEDPKLPVSVEIKTLKDTFTDVYGYDVEEWLIPAEDSHNQLQARILKFLGGSDPRHLKIVYYAGHGKLTNHGQPAWTSIRNRGSERCATVKWSGIQNTLEESRSDVLILLDCCASGVCTTDEGNGVTELIAACAYNAIANGVGPFSFTHALNSKLRQMASLPYFTVGLLYNAIFTEVQSWRVEDSRYKKAPVHLVLSQSLALPRSIRISKQLKRQEVSTIPVLLSPEMSIASANSSPSITPGGTQSPFDPFDNLLQPEVSPPSSVDSASSLPEYPRLLFSVRLAEDVKAHDLSHDLFIDWLRTIPVPANLVRVEAGFASNSTLMILSAPAAMLGYFPKDQAITLLGTILSGNLVPNSEDSSTALSSLHNVRAQVNRHDPKVSKEGNLIAPNLVTPLIDPHGNSSNQPNSNQETRSSNPFKSPELKEKLPKMGQDLDQTSRRVLSRHLSADTIDRRPTRLPKSHSYSSVAVSVQEVTNKEK